MAGPHREARSDADTRIRPQRPDAVVGPLEEEESTGAATLAPPGAERAADVHAAFGNQVVFEALSGSGLGGLGTLVAGEMAMAVGGVEAPSAIGVPSAMRRLLNDAGVDEGRADRAIGASSGQALDPAVRERMERAFGHDFSHVRVHVDGAAGTASEALQAHAFAIGSDLYFSRGGYAPGTPQGDRLLAHELTHVVQHDEGRLPSASGEGMDVSSPTDATEVEAYANEQRILGELGRVDAAPALDVGVDAGAPAVEGGAEAAPAAVEAAPVLRDPTRPATSTPATPASGNANASGEEGEQHEPSEEEIEQMCQDARQQGESQPAPEEPQPEQPAEEPVQTTEPQAQAEGEGEGGPEQAGPAVPELGQAGSPPPGFQQLRDSGALGGWDEELAWSDYFRQAESTPPEIDRDALIANAIGGGLWDGVKGGAWNLLQDTAINMASSRIPYLQGFVELARIAYDPQAWLEGQSAATVGKAVAGGQQIGQGFSDLLSGDSPLQGVQRLWALVDIFEGFINIADGINNVIGLISTILWIVAAASFVLGFICPALVPLAPLCAQWATTLGTISTLFGIYITVARAMIIALRALQIKYMDADPAALLERGERLRSQSQAFGSEFTTRVGNNVRTGMQSHFQNRRAQAAGDPPPPNNSPRPRPQRMDRLVNILSGNVAGPGVAGARQNAGDQARSAWNVTQAYRGDGTPRSTATQLADMEQAGATVAPNQRWRDRIDRAAQRDGQGGDARAAQRPGAQARTQHEAEQEQRRAQHQSDVEAASERLRRADRSWDRARRDVRQADRRVREAEAGLRQAMQTADNDAGVRAARQNVTAHQDQVQQASGLVREASGRVAHLESIQRQGLEMGDANHPVNRQIAADLARARGDLQAANELHTEATSGLNTARQRATELESGFTTPAQQTLDQATGARADASRRVNTTGAERDQLRTERNTLRSQPPAEQPMPDLPTGGTTLDNHAAQSHAERNYRWYTDFTGAGTNDLMGQNKGAGVTGAGKDLSNEIQDGVARQGENGAGGPFGLWSRTLSQGEGSGLTLYGINNDEDRNDPTRSGGYEASYQQLNERIEALRGMLPAPPMEAPGEVDGAAMAWAELDAEEQTLVRQDQQTSSLQEQGQVEIQSLTAVEQLAEANRTAVTAHQADLTQQMSVQDDAMASATQTGAEAQRGAQEGQRGGGLLDPIMGGLLRVMGLVPSRLSGNGGQGSAGAQRMGTAVTDATQNPQQVADGTGEVSSSVGQMKADTQASSAQATADDASLSQTGQAAATGRSEAEAGVTELQASQSSIQGRLGEIRAAKGQALARQTAATGRMTEWASSHAAMRENELAGLEPILAMLEGTPQP